VFFDAHIFDSTLRLDLLTLVYTISTSFRHCEPQGRNNLILFSLGLLRHTPALAGGAREERSAQHLHLHAGANVTKSFNQV
jgi:hypothetical protein